MKDLNGMKAETLINNVILLLNIAQENLRDLQRTLKDPKYLQTAYKTKELELMDKVNDLLSAMSDLKKGA